MPAIKSKAPLRTFVCAFLLTGVFLAFAAGMATVQASTYTYMRPTVPSILVEQTAPLDVTLWIKGNGYRLPMVQINEAVGFVQKYAPVFIPAPIRLLGQGATYGVVRYRQWYTWDLEERWKQSMT